MKNILFRAKRDDTKEWVYGYYAHMPDAVKVEDIIYTPAKNPDDHNHTYYIDPNTLGLYVGLTDKNGTKIFVGDILQGDEYPFCSDGDYNYYAEVLWFDDGCCGAGLYTHKNPKSTIRGISDGNCKWLDDFDSNNWLVIGNIFDNPEVIGKKVMG